MRPRSALLPLLALAAAMALLATPARVTRAEGAKEHAGETVHPWAFSSGETLLARVPTEQGFSRVDVAPGSFGAFLRTLPLAPEGAQVTDYRGQPLYEGGHHPNIAAVVDVDVGTADLQQCADAVLRMNAEWRYGRGERDVTYHAASGLPLSYARWLAGERVVVTDGKSDLRVIAGRRADSHAAMRAWLDQVFGFANTSSLAREGQAVASLAEIAPGDFFVSPGSPYGHAVLVVDVARAQDGRLALLLAQSYMPAQSFHVLRPGSGSAWFVVEPGAAAVATPFWAPFPRTSLRRLSR